MIGDKRKGKEKRRARSVLINGYKDISRSRNDGVYRAMHGYIHDVSDNRYPHRPPPPLKERKKNAIHPRFPGTFL